MEEAHQWFIPALHYIPIALRSLQKLIAMGGKIDSIGLRVKGLGFQLQGLGCVSV